VKSGLAIDPLFTMDPDLTPSFSREFYLSALESEDVFFNFFQQISKKYKTKNFIIFLDFQCKAI
jgi:hypothetical protein